MSIDLAKLFQPIDAMAGQPIEDLPLPQRRRSKPEPEPEPEPVIDPEPHKLHPNFDYLRKR